MALELYQETAFEIFDPQTGKQVALFFDRDEAVAYLDWRNNSDTPADDAGELDDDDEDTGLSGVGLVVSDTGELAIVHADGAMDEWRAFRTSDGEARALANLIDSVLD